MVEAFFASEVETRLVAFNERPWKVAVTEYMSVIKNIFF
jgi:hypothetical protein